MTWCVIKMWLNKNKLPTIKSELRIEAIQIFNCILKEYSWWCKKTSTKSSNTSLESEKEHFSRTVLLIFDLAAILLSFFTANYIRYRDIWQTEFPMDGRIPLLLLLFFYSVIYLIKSSTKEFYQRGPWEEMIIVLCLPS